LASFAYCLFPSYSNYIIATTTIRIKAFTVTGYINYYSGTSIVAIMAFTSLLSCYRTVIADLNCWGFVTGFESLHPIFIDEYFIAEKRGLSPSFMKD
jgi:hypothetical protein